MKKIVLVSTLSLVASFAFAKDEKQVLINNMVKACQSELAKDPALTDTSNGETVWKNLEDKEHAKVKFAKTCHAAHEKYEAKYHKEGENEEGEK